MACIASGRNANFDIISAMKVHLLVTDGVFDLGLAALNDTIGLANALGGTLVDDKRAPLGDASLAAIRGQLARVYAAMEARGIVAGSDTARRLFS